MGICEKIANRNVRLRKYIGIPFILIMFIIFIIWVGTIILFFIPLLDYSVTIPIFCAIILTTAFGIFGWIQATTSTLSGIKFNIGKPIIAPPYNPNVTKFPVVFESEGGLPFDVRFTVKFNCSSKKVNPEGNGLWKGEKEARYPPSAEFVGSSFHIEQTTFQNKDELMVEISYKNMFVKVIGITYRWYYDSGYEGWVLDIT